MAEEVLRLVSVSRAHVLGKKKNALKAQKAIRKLQIRLENEVQHHKSGQVTADGKRLRRAEKLFAQEKFEDCYELLTGKLLKKRPGDRGIVVHSLNDVSLKILEGDLVAIMGPSGSGKSTLLNILGLLDQPTAGLVFINHRNVTDIRPGALPDIRSHQLGYVFQSFNLIATMTALENVMLPLRYGGMSKRSRKAKAQEALEQVGLGDRLHHRPYELSGGQQQRVAIARSIVNNPAIIFGDELTGDLDSKMTEDVMDLICKLNEAGQTIVIVTHNPEVAKRCHRIIHMLDGKIEREERGKKRTQTSVRPTVHR